MSYIANAVASLRSLVFHRRSTCISTQPTFSPFVTKGHGLENMGLCKACNSLDIYLLPEGRQLIHFQNIFDLLKTSPNCRLCALLASHIMQRAHRSSLKHVMISDFTLPSTNTPLLVQMLKNGHLEFSGFWDGSIEFEIFLRHNSLPGTKLLPSQLISPRENLGAALYLSAPPCCTSSHDGVQLSIVDSGSPPVLPDRIIDIGASAEASEIKLFTNTNNWHGQYATLSHRWGGNIPFKTTRRNIARYTKCLNVHVLPQSFIDAIHLTRFLGIRYLWIDAICIIQDDLKDWEDQAVKMGSIYENSTITLALHSARSSSEGFLWRLNMSDYLEISTKLARKNNHESFWLGVPHLVPDATSIALQHSNIIQRAWCLQELRLAQRVLHIVEDRFLWACPHGNSPVADLGTVSGKFLSGDEGSQTSMSWLQLLQGYSKCSLTKATDKLPAIAGIHSRWQLPDASESYSGIFSADIHNSLLWYRHDERIDLTRCTGRAPFWSWASVDGTVRFVVLNCTRKASLAPCAKLISFDCKCGDKQSKSHFTCKDCLVLLHAGVGTGLAVQSYEKMKRFGRFYVDVRKVVTLSCKSTNNQSQDRCVGWAIFDKHPAPKQFSYILISSVSRKEEIIGYCVLLVELAKGLHNVYTRIGIGYIFQIEFLEGASKREIALN